MHAPQEHLHVGISEPTDLPALGRIWLELMQLHEGSDPHFALASDGLHRWLAMAREMLGRDDAFLLKAEMQCRVVGFCLGWVAHNPPIYAVTKVGFVSEIAVVRSAQRRGIGTALLQEARRWFQRRDLNEFQLSTAVWNKDARNFWEHNGGEPLLIRYRFTT